MGANEHPELQANSVDRTVAALRSFVGIAPFAGPLLSELVGSSVSGQRMDRLVQYAQGLEKRIAGLEGRSMEEFFADPNFAELLEEGAIQATHAVSEERIEQVAALVATGMTDSDISYAESRHLLRILGDLNDIEIIWLQSYDRHGLKPNPVKEIHQNILKPIMAYIGSEQPVHDKSALQSSYCEHLERLGLVVPYIDIDSDTGNVKFDKSTGRPESHGYKLTLLGSLMLRHLGIELRTR